MSISYPLTLPTSLGIEKFSWTCFNAVGMMRSTFSMQSQAQAHSGQLWAAQVDVGLAVDPKKAAPWQAFLASLMGPTYTFLMGDPNRTAPLGTPAGSPNVILSGQTGNGIGTRGWTPNAVNVLKAGDYIQIGQRLYMNLQNVSADALGNLNLDLWPRLRESPTIGTTIVTSNCVGLFRLADSEVKLHERDRELVYSITFNAVEAI